MGKKKKIMIIQAAQKKGMTVYNVGADYEEKVKDELAARKKQKKQKAVKEDKKEPKSKKTLESETEKQAEETDEKEKQRLEAEKVMIKG